MAKTIAKLLGVVFILVGIIGFIKHDFLGTHLNTTHNLVHLISGALALYFGMASTLAAARLFDIVFGVVYALLGVAGFLLGDGADRLFSIGTLLTLGTMDHVVHILLGVLFLFGGLLTKAGVGAQSD